MDTQLPRSYSDGEVWAFRSLGIALGFMLAFSVVVLVQDGFQSSDWSERGARGDFWGGHIAASASAVSTVLLVVTLLLQRQELELQRKELCATRNEMKLSREVYENQEQHLKKQVLIAEKTAAISRFMELCKSREQLRSMHKNAKMPSGLAATMRKHNADVDSRWHPRIAAVEDLLMDLTTLDCVSEEERQALVAIAGLEERCQL